MNFQDIQSKLEKIHSLSRSLPKYLSLADTTEESLNDLMRVIESINLASLTFHLPGTNEADNSWGAVENYQRKAKEIAKKLFISCATLELTDNSIPSDIFSPQEIKELIEITEREALNLIERAFTAYFNDLTGERLNLEEIQIILHDIQQVRTLQDAKEKFKPGSVSTTAERRSRLTVFTNQTQNKEAKGI